MSFRTVFSRARDMRPDKFTYKLFWSCRGVVYSRRRFGIRFAMLVERVDGYTRGKMNSSLKEFMKMFAKKKKEK